MWLILNGLASSEAEMAKALSDAIGKPIARLVIQNVTISGRLLPLLLRLLRDDTPCPRVHLVGSRCEGNLICFIGAILLQTHVETLCVYDVSGDTLTEVFQGLRLGKAQHLRRLSIVAGRTYRSDLDRVAMNTFVEGLTENISLRTLEINDFSINDPDLFGRLLRGALVPNLEELKISDSYPSHVRISSTVLCDVSSTPLLMSLRRLTLHRFPLSKDDWRGLAVACPALEYLDVQECDTNTVLPITSTLKTLHISWTLLRQPRIGKAILETLVGRKSDQQDDDDGIDDDPFAAEFEQTWRGARDAAIEAAKFAMDPFLEEGIVDPSSMILTPNTTLCDLGAMLDGEDSRKNSAVRWVLKFYLQLNKYDIRRNVASIDKGWVDTVTCTTRDVRSPPMSLGLTYYLLRRNPSVWSTAALESCS